MVYNSYAAVVAGVVVSGVVVAAVVVVVRSGLNPPPRSQGWRPVRGIDVNKFAHFTQLANNFGVIHCQNKDVTVHVRGK